MPVSRGCLPALIEGVKLMSDAIFKNSIYSRGRFVFINPPAFYSMGNRSGVGQTKTRLRRSPGRWSRLQTRLPRREGWRRANCSLPRIGVKCIMESICLSLHEYLHVINSSLGHLLPIQTDI